MENNYLELDNNNSILEKLVIALDGELPYMSKEEQTAYNNYRNEINENYNKFINSNNQYVPTDKHKLLVDLVANYEESCTCRNALLNDLYYKDGIRDGVSLILECLK